MELRPYVAADGGACLAVFDSNDLFPPLRGEFERFLQHPEGPYFVMEHEGATVACGGYTLSPSDPAVATLVWGMVRKDLQRQGLGRFLLMYRLREIGNIGGIERVEVAAPRSFAAFFQGQGFRIVQFAGDRVDLVKKLAVCA